MNRRPYWPRVSPKRPGHPWLQTLWRLQIDISSGPPEFDPCLLLPPHCSLVLVLGLPCLPGEVKLRYTHFWIMGCHLMGRTGGRERVLLMFKRDSQPGPQILFGGFIPNCPLPARKAVRVLRLPTLTGGGGLRAPPSPPMQNAPGLPPPRASLCSGEGQEGWVSSWRRDMLEGRGT